MTELTNDKQFRFSPQIQEVTHEVLPLLSPAEKDRFLREIEPLLAHRDWQIEDAISRALQCCGSGGGTAPGGLTGIDTSDTFSNSVANVSGTNTDALLGGTAKPWTTSSDTWPTNVTAGVLASPTTGSGIHTCTVDLTVTDQAAQFVLAQGIANNRVIGLVGRFQNANNYYAFRFVRIALGNQNLYLTKMVAGVQTDIAGPFAHIAVVGDTLLLTVVGTTVSGWLNGFQVLTVTDADLSTGTKAGVYAEADNASKVDNFVAYH